MRKKISWICIGVLIMFVAFGLVGCAENTASTQDNPVVDQAFKQQMAAVLASEVAARFKLLNLMGNANAADLTDLDWQTDVHTQINTISDDLTTLKSIQAPAKFAQDYQEILHFFNLDNQGCSDVSLGLSNINNSSGAQDIANANVCFAQAGNAITQANADFPTN